MTTPASDSLTGVAPDESGGNVAACLRDEVGDLAGVGARHRPGCEGRAEGPRVGRPGGDDEPLDPHDGRHHGRVLERARHGPVRMGEEERVARRRHRLAWSWRAFSRESGRLLAAAGRMAGNSRPLRAG